MCMLPQLKKERKSVGKKQMQHTISFRHDQFIQKIQISVWQSISRGREFGIVISLEAITFPRAKCPGVVSKGKKTKLLKIIQCAWGDNHKYLQSQQNNQLIQPRHEKCLCQQYSFIQFSSTYIKHLFIQDTGLAAGVEVEIQKSPRHNPCP